MMCESFNMHICYLFIFHGHMSVQGFWLFINQVVPFHFLIVEFKCSLYTLFSSPLSYVSFAKIISQFVAIFSLYRSAEVINFKEFSVESKKSILYQCHLHFLLGVLQLSLWSTWSDEHE